MKNSSVFIKKKNSVLIPKFSDCLLETCRSGEVAVPVKVDQVGNDVVITVIDTNGFGTLPESTTYLQHSPRCPIKLLSSYNYRLTPELVKRKIPVAVSVILESIDGYMVLTKRSNKMRSSPGVWVPPGGHLEKGESLLECGLRELYEETGLDVSNEIVSYKMLCIWENVFPLIPELGSPTNHTLIVYYHILASSSQSDFNKRMKIDPQEVAAYAWLPRQVFSQIFNQEDTETYPQKQYIFQNGKVIETDLKYMDMFNRFIWTSSTVYSGVQCSILKWYYADTNLKSKV